MSGVIFDDPIEGGAADPTVVRNQSTGEWWMFYTNRRPRFGGRDVSWIHGCAIGVATSPDGVTWTYRGTVSGLDAVGDSGLNTHWAPEIIFNDGDYHMYLTYLSGAPSRFEGEPRHIVHLTSPDLENWTRQSQLSLSSNKVIDAAVFVCPDGQWRLWYKDEAHGSGTWCATSTDLHVWTVDGEVIPGSPTAPPHEGPNVFALGGYIWMIVDEWRGQAVYRSTDAFNWQRQSANKGLILDKRGNDPLDRGFARHADVVVIGEEAALFYFTHPEWDEAAKKAPETSAERRSTIHVARVWVENGELKADRNVSAVTLS